MSFKIIFCVEKTFGFGYKNSIPWNIKEELKYFKQQTLETTNKNKKNAVIMGRKTFESIIQIPSNINGLVGRINIVISSNENLKEKYKNHDSIKIVNNITELEELIKDYQKLDIIETFWIIGGLSLITYGINKGYDVYLTKINENYTYDIYFNYYLLHDYKIFKIELNELYCHVKKKNILVNYFILKKIQY